MNNIQIQPYNPYLNDQEEKERYSSIGQAESKKKFTYIYNKCEDDKFTEYAIALNDKLFSKDFEKYVERAGYVIELADKSLTVFSGGLSGAVIMESVLRKIFYLKSLWQSFPEFMKIIMIPLRSILFIFTFFEIIYETIHLKRTIDLLKSLNIRSQDLQGQFLWLQKEYFSLTDKEIYLIKEYIEWKDKDDPIQQKRQHFACVSEKLLKIKRDALKRRISPWLVEEVEKAMPQMMLDLLHGDTTTKNQAELKAQDFVKNIDIQGKKLIFFHSLSLLALTFFMIGLISTIVATGGISLLVCSVVSSSILFSRYILAKGMLPEKGWHFSATNMLPTLFSSKKVPASS